jgi:RNA polymerase sigma-70 factor (ECF subfamily)
MSNTELNTDQLQQLIACQDGLYAYILSLVAVPSVAEDVLQESNLVICRKAGQESIEQFTAWMYRIAHVQVLAYRKRHYQDRHLFSDALVGALAVDGMEIAGMIDGRRDALEHCLDHLSRRQRDLILQRYYPGASVTGLAEKLGRSVGSISQTLYRIRTALLQCIERTLSTESPS